MAGEYGPGEIAAANEKAEAEKNAKSGAGGAKLVDKNAKKKPAR